MGFRLFFLLFLVLSVDVQWVSAAAARHLGVYRPPSSAYTPPSSDSSPEVDTPASTPSSASGSSPSSSYAPSPSFGGSPDSETPPSYSRPSSGSFPPVRPHQEPSSNSYTPPSSGSSPVTEGPSSSYTPPSSGSSPVAEAPPLNPPYTSSSGSSPADAGSPLSSPVNIGSPLSSPVVGSPSSSPAVIGSPLSTPIPEISTPIAPSAGDGGGGKGTCGFWSKHGVRFPSILSGITSLGSIFGGRAPSIFGAKMTLVEALVNPNLDEYSTLARQGTASLLNAYAYPNGFPFTPAQVRENFNLGLQSPQAARQQASLFERANNALP